MVLLPSTAWTQGYGLIVMDAERMRPLENVAITERETGRIRFSDKEGQCRIPDPNPRLRISHIGFESIDAYRMKRNQTDTVYLWPKRLELNEVNLVATHPRSIYQRLIRAKRVSRPQLLTYREAFRVDGMPKRQLQAQFAVSRLRTRFAPGRKWHRQFSIYGYNLDYLKYSPQTSPWDRGFVPNRDIARLFYLNTTVGFLFRPGWIWSWHERSGPGSHRTCEFRVRHEDSKRSYISGSLLYPEENDGAYRIFYEYLPESHIEKGGGQHGRRLRRQCTELWIDYKDPWFSLRRVRFIEEGEVYDSGSFLKYRMEIELFNHGNDTGLSYSKSGLDPNVPWHRQLGKENPGRALIGDHPKPGIYGTSGRSIEE